MEDAINAYLSTDDATNLQFTKQAIELVDVGTLYTCLCCTALKREQIQALSSAFREQLQYEHVARLFKINSDACNLAEAYKIRHFALIFDPCIQNVYERLIDRAATVRNEAVAFAASLGYVADDKVAYRLVTVLQNSDDRLLRLLVDTVEQSGRYTSEYLSTYIRSQIDKITNVHALLILSGSVWDAYLRYPKAFPIVFFEKILGGYLYFAQIAQFATKAVLEWYNPNFLLPESIIAANNLLALDHIEQLLKYTSVNPNQLKKKMLELVTAERDVEVLESYGYVWAGCWLDLGLDFAKTVYKNCRNYQGTYNKVENIAILYYILRYVTLNIAKPEWTFLAGEIAISYLSHVNTVSREKHAILIEFLGRITAHSKLLEQNASDIESFVKQIEFKLHQLYENVNQIVDSSFDYQQPVLYLIYIGTAFVANIAQFADGFSNVIPLLFKLRNTLGKLAATLASAIFNSYLDNNSGFVYQLYELVIYAVNVTLITPGDKDYNFETIDKWVIQLLQYLDTYSSNTFLKSAVYIKEPKVDINEIKTRSSLVFATVANCVDLVSLYLLFGVPSALDQLILYFGRLIYHLSSSSTLQRALDTQQLLLDAFQPVYAKLFNLCSFVDISTKIGCILGLLLSVSSGERFVTYLLEQLNDYQTPVAHLAGILAGICCATSAFRFGDEPTAPLLYVVLAVAKANPLPAVFLCAGKDKVLDLQLKKVLDDKTLSISTNDLTAVRAQLLKLGLAEADPAADLELERERYRVVHMLSNICKQPASFLDAIYE